MYKLITFSTLLLCLWSCDSSEDSANLNQGGSTPAGMMVGGNQGGSMPAGYQGGSMPTGYEGCTTDTTDPKKCIGNLRFSSQVEIDALKQAGYKIIVGSVSIIDFDNSTLDLSFIERIEKFFNIVPNPQITNILFDSITYVGGDFYVGGNNALTSISLPVLASVHGTLYIAHNALTSISLPVLASVLYGVVYIGDDNVTSISLPSLNYVGGESVEVFGSALATCEIPLMMNDSRLPAICQ